MRMLSLLVVKRLMRRAAERAMTEVEVEQVLFALDELPSVVTVAMAEQVMAEVLDRRSLLINPAQESAK